MLIQFYLNGGKFVRFHEDVPLPPGAYLCFECADEKTLFNGADMKQTRRRGVIVNDGCPYFPPENWLFVQEHPRTVFLRTSHEDVVTALSVGDFRANVESSIWRAIEQAEIQCREACFLRGRGYVLQRVQRRAGEAGRRADMARRTRRCSLKAIKL